MRRSGVRSSFGPPLFSAQLFLVGRFRFRNPHTTLRFRAVLRMPRVGGQGLRFTLVSLSLLSKPALTSKPWTTQCIQNRKKRSHLLGVGRRAKKCDDVVSQHIYEFSRVTSIGSLLNTDYNNKHPSLPGDTAHSNFGL